MKKLFVTAEDYAILKNILDDKPYDILVFGSRTKGTQQLFSDLDLCLKAKAPISLDDLACLKEELSESDLPFIVDIIDYDSTSEGFQKIIDKEAINFLETKAVL